MNSNPSEQSTDSTQDNQSGTVVDSGIVNRGLQSEFKVETKTRKVGETHPRAFVLMPAGRKMAQSGLTIDFDNVFSALVEPSLSRAGFTVCRWIGSSTSDLMTDSFQELLLANLVVVDISVEDADVFYNMGIRHAFRKRGILHICAGQSLNPFGVFNVRIMPYHCNKYGRVNSSTQKQDQSALANFVTNIWASEPDAIHSPIYTLLSGLAEPNLKSLRTPLATGFWREYNEWKQRATIAQRQHRIGDILLLTEEIENAAIKEEAIGEAGKALQNMGLDELALQQYRKGLEINPRNLSFRRQEAIFIKRLGRVEEAIVKLENLLNELPTDTESIATLGRIYKDMWTDSWKRIKDKTNLTQTAYESYHWLVKAFNTYLKGYQFDLDNTYPGVNALTLGIILVHLADCFEDKEDPDPDITRIRELLPELGGALHFALDNHLEDETVDYWTLVSKAELKVLTAKKIDEVVRAYRKAIAVTRRNLFFVQESVYQLEILKSLDIRPEFVDAGFKVMMDELHRIQKEETSEDDFLKPRLENPRAEGNIFLFTGYMIDHATKKENHFPPESEPDIKKAIEAVLVKYNAGPADLAITTGMAAGSEIIFVELAVERGIAVRVYLPTSEASYVRDFVSPGGDQWLERFYRMRNDPLVDEFFQPDQVGLPKEGDNIYDRNNRWAFYSALLRGIDKARFVALWDGKTEPCKDLDAYLVKHMVELVRENGGMVEHINPHKPLSSFVINAMPERSLESVITKKKPVSKRKS